MNPIQESRNELEASIRYAENAISSAKQTIESMATYQEQTGREAALEREVEQLKAEVDKLRLDKVCAPTMPVIPKDVAIAIFREGVQSGIADAVAELEGQTINVCENEYCGDFEVTFARDIHLDDEIDFDWMRDKAGQYNEKFVMGALKGLCEKEDFECRIHGIDDQGDDSKSA
jgi:hypothetical protein